VTSVKVELQLDGDEARKAAQAAKVAAEQRFVYLAIRAGRNSCPFPYILLTSLPLSLLSPTFPCHRPDLIPSYQISKRHSSVASVLDRLRPKDRSWRITRCARGCHAR
jgi:hypothetical protein